MKAMRWLMGMACVFSLEADAATWVVDDLAYTNGSEGVEVHDLAWAIGGVNSATGEAHVVSIASSNAMSADATFWAPVQVNGSGTNATMGIRFARGGGASLIRLDGAEFDAGGGGGSLADCTVVNDVLANGNALAISGCDFGAGVDALELGTGSSFSGNTFRGGRLVAHGATVSGNTFDSSGEVVDLRVGSGDIGVNAYTGAPLRMAIGTNLYVAGVEMAELEIVGDGNVVNQCAVRERLFVRGTSNYISQCVIEDGQTTNSSISVEGDLNEIRYCRFSDFGGLRIVGDDCQFRDNWVYGNRFGIRLEGNRGIIKCNRIGFSTNGEVVAFSGDGIVVIGDDNRIGSEMPSTAEGNHVVGGSGFGIRAEGSMNGLRGNWVGAVTNGESVLVGGFNCGIFVGNGVSNALDANVVAASTGDAIVLTNSPWTQVKDSQIGIVLSNRFESNGGHGLRMEHSPHADIWGNWISGCGQSGMSLFDVPDSEIVGNRVGYVPEIFGGASNGLHGIHVVNSSNVVVGKRGGLDNVVAGNGGHGIFVERSSWREPDSLCGGLKIRANWIGHYEGAVWTNGGDGVRLYGVSNAWVGWSGDVFDGNSIGNSGGAGLALLRCQAVEVYNNLIGVWYTPGSTVPMPNEDGIRGDAIVECRIGGGEPNEHNYVSCNRRDGIVVWHDSGTPSNNVFQGNFVGVDSTGLSALPNGGDGLKVSGNSNYIGGVMGPLGGERAGNVLSGNASNGLVVAGWSNVVAGNHIGVDDIGSGALGNGRHGVVSQCSYGQLGTPELGNVIGGNGGHGIYMNGAGLGNRIQNNRIGVGLDGLAAVGNGLSGIGGQGAGGATIGGTGENEANYVGNNGWWGVRLAEDWGGNEVVGNWIGMAPPGMAFGVNAGGGVRISESTVENGIKDNWIDGAVGIQLEHTFYQRIEGNVIGFDPGGSHVSSNLNVGIDLVNAGGNHVGGEVGNAIGGAREAGISIFHAEGELAQWGYGNHVYANRIGTETNWAGAVTNGGEGIRLSGTRRNFIGSATHPNWIANSRRGIWISNSASNDVCGNRVGLTPTGAVPGNRGCGIRLDACVGDEIGITSGSATNEAGNVVVGSGEDGVYAFNCWKVGIAGNTIGHLPDTLEAYSNKWDGVRLSMSSNCLVGLFMAGPVHVFRGNAIGGNQGNGVYDGGGKSNWIGGNAIGVASNRFTPIPNGHDGIRLVLTVDDEIGSGYQECYDDGGNVISCNAGNGISLWSNTGLRSANVQGNVIGSDATETLPLGNGGDGIQIDGSGKNRIGDGWEDCRNVVVDNGGNGILIMGSLSVSNRLLGNCVGVTRAGEALGNAGHGVAISNAAGTVVGIGSTGGNAVGGNRGCGVRIDGPGTASTSLRGNWIGVALDGATACANAGDGICAVRSESLAIGGTDAMDGNVISFNGENGIQLVECDGAVVQGTRVGVNSSATVRQGNGGCGILVSNSAECVIGPYNAIGANGAEGLRMSGPSCDGALIAGNWIGVSCDGMIDLGNAGDGIGLRGGDRNRVTGSNVVARNFGHGVAVYTGARNTVMGNQIFGNALAAIHVATNEPGMEPNEGIRPPTITNALTGSTHFQGTFAGKTNEPYVLDVHYAWFTNQNGAQAQFALAQTNFTTGANGEAWINLTLSESAPFGSYLSMNATDTNGNSSALSEPVRVLDEAYLNWRTDRGVTNEPDGHMDDDGIPNIDEYIADTDPRDGSSFLSMAWVATNAKVSHSSTGRLYTVETATNLVGGVWLPLENHVDLPGNGGDLPVDLEEWLSRQPSAFSLRVKVRLP